MAVEFENDRVRVTRQSFRDHAWSTVGRSDRLIIWLRDGHVERRSDGKHEIVSRRAGEFVWRDASDHVVKPHSNEHEVLIIEFKDAPTDGVSREMWEHFQQLASDDHDMQQAEIERLRKALSSDV